MLSDDVRRKIAQELLAADLGRYTIEQPSSSYPGMELEDAYAIQGYWAEKRIERGAHQIGHKIGLTSRAMQKASKISEPDYGVIFDDAAYVSGAIIDARRFVKPRLEVELAFVLRNDLSGHGCRAEDVLRATEFVTPAIEIIDYRTETPREIVDTIADNAAFGAVVTGGRMVRPFDCDLRWIGATLSQNGVIEESGVSAAVMGHPAHGIAWLVNKLAQVNGGLSAGDLVLSGAFTRPVDIEPGDVLHADFGSLGGLDLAFQRNN